MKTPPDAEGCFRIPKPDIGLMNAGTANPMDRETRYAGAKMRTASDTEDMDG